MTQSQPQGSNNDTAAALVEALTPDPLPPTVAAVDPEEDPALQALLEALQQAAPYGEMDLSIVADKTLSDADTAYFYRLNWVLSLVRLRHFLQRAPKSFDQEERQAQMGLGFLKHLNTAEAQEKLKLGRRRTDDQLVSQVTELQSRLTLIIDRKQRAKTASQEYEAKSG